MWKNVLLIAAVALLGYCSYQQNRGRIASEAYQARDAQNRQYGSECLPMSATDGRSGWSYNLQLIIDQGKGSVFSTQNECEMQFQAATGKSARRR